MRTACAVVVTARRRSFSTSRASAVCPTLTVEAQIGPRLSPRSHLARPQSALIQCLELLLNRFWSAAVCTGPASTVAVKSNFRIPAMCAVAEKEKLRHALSLSLTPPSPRIRRHSVWRKAPRLISLPHVETRCPVHRSSSARQTIRQQKCSDTRSHGLLPVQDWTSSTSATRRRVRPDHRPAEHLCRPRRALFEPHSGSHPPELYPPPPQRHSPRRMLARDPRLAVPLAQTGKDGPR